MGLSRIVCEIKSDKCRILPPRVFIAVGLKKTRMMPLLDGQKFDVTSFRLDTVPALERHTDGQTVGQTDEFAIG